MYTTHRHFKMILHIKKWWIHCLYPWFVTCPSNPLFKWIHFNCMPLVMLTSMCITEMKSLLCFPTGHRFTWFFQPINFAYHLRLACQFLNSSSAIWLLFWLLSGLGDLVLSLATLQLVNVVNVGPWLWLFGRQVFFSSVATAFTVCRFLGKCTKCSEHKV